MVTQVNLKSSVVADVTPLSLVAVKPQPVPEQARTAQIADSLPAREEGATVKASEKDLSAAVQEVRTHLEQSGTKLEIQYDKGSGRDVIKLIDPGTGGVLVQFPPEEVLAMARKLRETANAQDTAGVLMDKEG